MKKFYKERVVPFRICKICSVEYRTTRNWTSHLGLCYKHRKEFRQQRYLVHREENLAYSCIWYKNHVLEHRATAFKSWVNNRNQINRRNRERARAIRAIRASRLHHST